MIHLRKAQSGHITEAVSQFAPEMNGVNFHLPELPTVSQPETDLGGACRPSVIAQNFPRSHTAGAWDTDAHALLAESSGDSDDGSRTRSIASIGSKSGESPTRDQSPNAGGQRGELCGRVLSTGHLSNGYEWT